MIHTRLLEIALEEFAAKGLEGASTRGIAAKAGTAMSSITYHFGGKEGLYLAVADHIAEQMGEHPVSLAAEAGIREGMSAEDARRAIKDILRHFVDAMTGPKSMALSLFIAREQMAPTEAFDRIYAGKMAQMLRTLVELVRIATGREDGDTAVIAVVTLVGQVGSVRSSRAAVLKLLGRKTLDAATVAHLSARIVANTDAILDRLIAERQELS